MHKYIDHIYELPAVDKFLRVEQDEAVVANETKLQQLLVDIFKDFGVEVSPSNIYHGSRKTRIEFYLPRGKKISVCKRLEPDLALHTRIPNLKVVAPVPGKSTIAIDITRNSADTLPIGNGLFLYDKYKTNGEIEGFLGLNIEGRPVRVNLSDGSHLMFLGTTGSGKSIALQGFLMSLLMKYNPCQLSICLASAYGATFPVFDKLPHLCGTIANSVRSLKYNLEALKKEIEKRLQLFKTTKTTSLNSFNALIEENKLKLEQATNKLKTVCTKTTIEDRLEFLKTRIKDLLVINEIKKTSLSPLPKIVCIIDDANYLMPIEESNMYQDLTYILRHGSAVGISVILAAQTAIFTKTYPDLLANIKHRAVFFSTKESECKRLLDDQGISELPAFGVCLYQAFGDSAQEVQTYNVTHSDCVTIANHWTHY